MKRGLEKFSATFLGDAEVGLYRFKHQFRGLVILGNVDEQEQQRRRVPFGHHKVLAGAQQCLGWFGFKPKANGNDLIGKAFEQRAHLRMVQAGS